MAISEREKLVESWYALFRKGTDFDSWGQLVEAVDEYALLTRKIKTELQFEEHGFSDQNYNTLGNVVSCLQARQKAVQNQLGDDGMTLEQLKTVGTVLQNLLTSRDSEFPIKANELSQLNDGKQSSDVAAGNNAGSESPHFQERKKLRPRMPLADDMTLLTIRIERIGLKDASQCIEPYISVSVKDGQAMNLTPSQDTLLPVAREDQYIIFNANVEIQQYLEKMPKTTAVFFELKHYKPKKRQTSTKCFAFMEMDEIKPGPACLEIYRKPTDFKRKRLGLLTTKPLYLYLNLNLHRT
ncbi:axin interactor, dorsalization-associated protein-like [Corticium candelabrum]|uniref:axin interactor, dorsalization-associated protein-like n=1 Tax=Corticium candelabrum TaxID=121492 RepID=UPI002E26DC88|nr:axin interactor, dorsalization-associated protein-like [Corticium candelabrum]